MATHGLRLGTKPTHSLTYIHTCIRSMSRLPLIYYIKKQLGCWT